MTTHGSIAALVLLAAAAPLPLLATIGMPALARRPLPERVIGALARLVFMVSFAAFGAAAALIIASGAGTVEVSIGEWFSIAPYHFRLGLLVDGLSLPFALFAVMLCGVIAAFAHRYLHREPGYARFFVLLSTFTLGILTIVLAGSIEVAFAGWELLGLSSALLIAFFQDRPLAVSNALRAFVVYRVCDIGLLIAAVLVHHWCGTGNFVALFGRVWPGGSVPLTGARATVIVALLVVSAMGKCAQVPFSGWLPRAMEGPTPSSAIFYGALSVHAGAYLLLRFEPLIAASPTARVLIAVIGLVSAVHATLVGRTQTDIKTVLAYASLTQVGLILFEIALGLPRLALVHIIGHACIRSLQFLRAPSLLHDLHGAENAVGGHVARSSLHFERIAPQASRRWLYRFALERAYLDAVLETVVVTPLLKLFRAFDVLERRWVILLDGKRSATAPAAAESKVR